MATEKIRKAFQNTVSWMLASSDKSPVDNTLGTCWIVQLPPEILQAITEYLTPRDINSLSRTCQDFYTLINDDNFWIHRIRSQFSPSMADLYTYDVFQNFEPVETNEEPRPTGFTHTKNESQLDQFAITSATHYNDEAIERRHAKIYISKEDFSKQVEYFQFKQPKDYTKVPLMKLMYFYIIDRKRQATVDMGVIHRNDRYLVERNDRDSLKGKIIHLESVCWLEITGEFEHNIMPGKYDVIWRMKTHGNYIRIWGETEFIVVPSCGRLLIYKISENDFRTYGLENNDQWFLVNMGQTIIYEASKVLVGIRNWNNGNWKSGISWDCIELKVTA